MNELKHTFISTDDENLLCFPSPELYPKDLIITGEQKIFKTIDDRKMCKGLILSSDNEESYAVVSNLEPISLLNTLISENDKNPIVKIKFNRYKVSEDSSVALLFMRIYTKEGYDKNSDTTISNLNNRTCSIYDFCINGLDEKLKLYESFYNERSKMFDGDESLFTTEELILFNVIKLHMCDFNHASYEKEYDSYVYGSVGYDEPVRLLNMIMCFDTITYTIGLDHLLEIYESPNKFLNSLNNYGNVYRIYGKLYYENKKIFTVSSKNESTLSLIIVTDLDTIPNPFHNLYLLHDENSDYTFDLLGYNRNETCACYLVHNKIDINIKEVLNQC